MTQEENTKCAVLDGWKKEDDGIWYHDEFHGVLCTTADLPRYDRDANAALRLCGVMEEKGYTVTIDRVTQANGTKAWLIAFDNGRPRDTALSESFSEAICTAALRAEGAL